MALSTERALASFPVEKMTLAIYDGQANVDVRRRIGSLLASDPVFARKERRFASAVEQYVHGLEQMKRLVELSKLNKLQNDEEQFLARRELDMDIPMGLHEGMFLPTIKGQGTEEQIAEWVPIAKAYRIIGTYAQTELGHGSYVRGLETTATYDAATKEFVMNTPTLTATKWWPGGLGKTSTHAVVMAQLYTQGKCYGVHPFIVQLRSLEDHYPLPGVTVGDIGPKFGYEPMDNGFLRFNNVRIPRKQMLMRFAQVAEDGTYSKPANVHSKIAYATMVGVRAYIVIDAAVRIAKATTIAVRYSAVRKQFPIADGEPEQAVLNYQSQQALLLPLVATAYAFFFCGISMRKKYYAFLDGVSKNDFSVLPEMHASSSGLKSYTTWIATEGIETCRQSCGGHGYSKFSGLGNLYADYIPSTTYEGDNTIMCFQASRFLLKAASTVAQTGKPLGGSLSYIGNDAALSAQPTIESAADWRSTATLLAAFRRSAAYLLQHVGGRVLELTSAGRTQERAFEEVKVDLVRLAKAHSALLVLEYFAGALETCDASLRPILKKLCHLHAIWVMQRSLGEFMESGFVLPAHCPLLHEAFRQLLAELRPDSVSLVDAFDFTDFYLNSALGKHDGDVYETLYEWAQGAPLNKDQVGPGYRQFIRPMIRAGL